MKQKILFSQQLKITGKIILALFCLHFSGSKLQAQTTLVAGDIAFTGYNSNSNPGNQNDFSFVILRTGGIASGTVINFTDNGWNSIISSLGTTEGTVTWTSTSVLPQFSEVYINIASTGTTIESTNKGSAAVTGSMIFSQAGDQVIAYQGASASPTFIAGIHMNSEVTNGTSSGSNNSSWDDLKTGGWSISSNRSGIPPGLTGGVNAIMVVINPGVSGAEKDNASFNCAYSIGSILSDLRAKLNNPANWNLQDVLPYTLPTGCSFKLGSPPAIITQPLGKSICAGVNASFNVVASDATSYQWQVDKGSGFTNISNAAPFSGATTATLTITGATASLNGYQYRVVATGSASPNATSNSVLLTVNSAPQITTQPGNTLICAGTNTSYTIAASNATSYQWQVNQGAGFTNISNTTPYSGATTTTLTVTGANAGMNGYQYRAIVSGGCNPAATSTNASLSINTAPVITTQPVNSTVCPGSNTTFTVAATNGTSYLWQVDQGLGFTNLSNAVPYTGVTTATLNITGATSGLNGSKYRVLVSGNCTPSATSNQATLNSNDVTKPTINNCTSNILANASSGKCSANVTWTSPTALDNCSVASFTSNFLSGASFPVGTTKIIYTAKDPSNNENTCSFNVTVLDIEAPIITNCSKDTTITVGTYSYPLPAVSDNCSGAPLKLTSGLGSGSIFPTGKTIVIYTAKDTTGNTSVCQFSITANNVLTAIDEYLVQGALEFAPNPSTGTIHIRTTQNTLSPLTIEWKNLSGKIVQEDIISGNQNDYTLNIESLPPGIYMAEIIGLPTRIIKRVVIY